MSFYASIALIDAYYSICTTNMPSFGLCLPQGFIYNETDTERSIESYNPLIISEIIVRERSICDSLLEGFVFFRYAIVSNKNLYFSTIQRASALLLFRAWECKI